MEWKDMYPQINQPSFEAMAEYIGGEARGLWDSLFDYMNRAYGAKPKMSYSVCSGKPGWNVKFQRSGQSFGTLYPEEGSFSVFMVISYKHEAEMVILRNELSPEMRAQYDNAQDYMKMGRWLMFRICNKADLRDYKLLMSVKMKPKDQSPKAAE
ncbi:MAG: DUF3788 domain-containing protein [Clostridiaceae bacterium]|jgi:hypothetical protein|nr:DUF3788 domain-containing protein [Clostridiaceae bacterium]